MRLPAGRSVSANPNTALTAYVVPEVYLRTRWKSRGIGGGGGKVLLGAVSGYVSAIPRAVLT